MAGAAKIIDEAFADCTGGADDKNLDMGSYACEGSTGTGCTGIFLRIYPSNWW